MGEISVCGLRMANGVGGNLANEEKAVAHAHVLLAEDRVLLLAGGVEDVEHDRVLVHNDLLAVVGLDGRVVALHKVALHKADRKRALADTCGWVWGVIVGRGGVAV